MDGAFLWIILIVAIFIIIPFSFIYSDEKSRREKEEENKNYRSICDSYIDIARSKLNPDFVFVEEFVNLVESEVDDFKPNEMANDDNNYDFNIKYFGLLVNILLWMRENEYDKVLSHKKRVLIIKDDYWDDDPSGFINEYNSFIKKRLDVLLDYIQSNYKGGSSDESFNEFVLKVISNAESFIRPEEPDFDIDSVVDPYEYERVISEIISNVPGWSARVTSGSGDQGADVIAKYDSVYLVVQCKLYSSPVGNKAVQEVAAAKGFYSGSHAVVVTNSSFTKSAKLLANNLGVTLLHHNQLIDYLESISVDID